MTDTNNKMKSKLPNELHDHHTKSVSSEKTRSLGIASPLLLSLVTQLLLGLQLTSSLSPHRLANALKVSVAIPELVKLNDAFWLNCSQNNNNNHNANQQLATSSANGFASDQSQPKTGAEIYAIKWYKDEEEFYRYLPNAEPKVSIYETNGIQLDQSRSFQGNVFITKADVNSEGNYRCEILSEAPIFETVRKSKHLKVYALPVRGPKIEILDSNGRPKHPKDKEFSYAVGDKIELRCNSAPSKPAARLRWYLNDHELLIPVANSTQQAESRQQQFYNRQGATATTNQHQQLQNYNVRVTPIEYRQHYKGIYSSHSTLSFILQQNDLVNSRISFKCLASMRQEIPVQSKQLILLTPQQQQSLNSLSLSSSNGGGGDNNNYNKFRFKRLADLLLDELTADPNGDQLSPKQRHRAQYNRRPSSSSRAMQHQQQQQQQPQPIVDSNPIRELINSGQADEFQLAYVHEESDSTLGPSIIDSPELLERYLADQQQQQQQVNSYLDANNSTGGGNFALDFNRGDNLDYIQSLRDRVAKQRQPPNPIGVGGTILTASKSHRLHGSINSIVKSPLYLDELDSLRPIINWPPIETGKLMLLPPGHTIVAIATQQQQRSNQQQARPSEIKFVLPPKMDNPSATRSASERFNQQQQQQSSSSKSAGQSILEKLMENLNCTCTEGSIDTKLNWLINDLNLVARDTRFYATRVSPDHRQTWLTIGLQTNFLNNNNNLPATTTMPTTVTSSAISRSSNAVTLQSIMGQYYNKPQDTVGGQSKLQQHQHQRDSRQPTGTNQALPASNEQIRFICQAIHSMLLYSGSEMITFDFNPPPLNELDSNSIDKFQSQPSNVIQATSASQSSSASSYLTPKSMRSQSTLATVFINTTILLTTMYRQLSLAPFVLSYFHYYIRYW